MSRARRAGRIVTVLALLSTALPEVAGGDSLPDPVRITVERIVLLAEGFVDGPVARHLERATNGLTAEETASIVGTWHERRPCEAPVERAPSGPVEVGGWLGSAELDGASVGELLEDGWGRPIEVWFELRELAPPLLVLRSAGANGRFEGPAYRVGADGSTAGSDDLVWSFDGFCWAPAIGIGEEERPPRKVGDRGTG